VTHSHAYRTGTRSSRAVRTTRHGCSTSRRARTRRSRLRSTTRPSRPSGGSRAPRAESSSPACGTRPSRCIFRAFPHARGRVRSCGCADVEGLVAIQCVSDPAFLLLCSCLPSLRQQIRRRQRLLVHPQSQRSLLSQPLTSAHHRSNFLFKCHRRDTTPTSKDQALVYAVNDILFHPMHGSSASPSARLLRCTSLPPLLTHGERAV
jgi:hypothetical protein